MANKQYYKLRDAGTSFYDTESDEKIVRDQVKELTNTKRVREAVSRGILIKTDAPKEETKKSSAKSTDSKTDAKSTDKTESKSSLKDLDKK